MDRIDEIRKRIDQLESLQFMLSMKDRFTEYDFMLDRQYSKEISELKDELKVLKNGRA